MERSGFHHVALRAMDLEKTVAFYEALGGKVFKRWGEGDQAACMVDLGGGNIMEIFAGGKDPTEQHPHFEHIALRSSNADADYKAALAAGATKKTEPADADLGNYPIRIAFVTGLNGETIEFFQVK